MTIGFFEEWMEVILRGIRRCEVRISCRKLYVSSRRSLQKDLIFVTINLVFCRVKNFKDAGNYHNSVLNYGRYFCQLSKDVKHKLEERNFMFLSKGDTRKIVNSCRDKFDRYLQISRFSTKWLDILLSDVKRQNILDTKLNVWTYKYRNKVLVGRGDGWRDSKRNKIFRGRGWRSPLRYLLMEHRKWAEKRRNAKATRGGGKKAAGQTRRPYGTSGEQRSDVGLTDSLPFVQTNQNGLRINMRLRAKANARMLGHDPSMYEEGHQEGEKRESRATRGGWSTSGI